MLSAVSTLQRGSNLSHLLARMCGTALKYHTEVDVCYTLIVLLNINMMWLTRLFQYNFIFGPDKPYGCVSGLFPSSQFLSTDAFTHSGLGNRIFLYRLYILHPWVHKFSVLLLLRIPIQGIFSLKPGSGRNYPQFSSGVRGWDESLDCQRPFCRSLIT